MTFTGSEPSKTYALRLALPTALAVVSYLARVSLVHQYRTPASSHRSQYQRRDGQHHYPPQRYLGV